MPRKVNPDDYAEKRREILNVVRKLVYTKGYAQMTIQDILEALAISKGAFYHYFDSKQALLEGLIEQMMAEAEGIVLPIVHHAELSAIEKFQQFFGALNTWKASQKAFVVALLRVWFADDNALVRDKVNVMMLNHIAPMFNDIVAQGIEEGVFSTPYPERAGEVILSITIGLQTSIGHLMFVAEKNENPQEQVEEIVSTYAVYVDAMERTINAPSGSLFRLDAEIVQIWVDALRDSSV